MKKFKFLEELLGNIILVGVIIIIVLGGLTIFVQGLLLISKLPYFYDLNKFFRVLHIIVFSTIYIGLIITIIEKIWDKIK